MLHPGAGPGGVARRGQNPFCTNIDMLHIKSKVMKSRIQLCKILPRGRVWGSQEVKKENFGPFILLSHNSS